MCASACTHQPSAEVWHPTKRYIWIGNVLTVKTSDAQRAYDQGMKYFGIISLILACAFTTTQTFAEDWPQWRGPARDGTVKAEAWPDSLDEQHLTQQWRVELAEGYASPFIAGDKVFTVETRDKQDEIVRAFNLNTGEELWAVQWAASMTVPGFARKNGSWVRSTPATDGERLYVGGMRDVLVCLDVNDGSEVFRVDFTERYDTNVPSFGYVSSPLIDGDAVYAQAGLSVCKIDKLTGKEIWRTLADERAMWGSAFSSPIIAHVAGVRQLVVQTRMTLCGVNLETGDVLWTIPIKAFRGMNILPPTVFNGNEIFTATYGGGTFVVKVDKDDDAFKVTPSWMLEMQGYMSSPVVIDGHAYLHRRDKKFSCINLSTGKETWTHAGGFGEYWSMVVNGKQILALDQDATLRLINADPAVYKPVSARRVADAATWAHVAVVGKHVVIRELKGLSVWTWKTP